MKISEDLGQILVVLHTLLLIIEMPPRLNKQSGSCNEGAVSLDPSAALLCLRTGLTSISQSQASDTT